MERGSCNLHFHPVIHILGFTVNTLCDYWTAEIETVAAPILILVISSVSIRYDACGKK